MGKKKHGTSFFSSIWEVWLKSITKKYLLLFALLFIIPLALIYQLIIGSTESIVEEDITAKNAITANALAKRLDREILDIVLQLSLIADQEEDKPIDLQKMFRRSKEAVSNSSFIQSIYFIDLEKRIRFEAPFHSNSVITDYEYPPFDDIRWSLNFVVSDYMDNPRGEKAVTVAIPVLKNNVFYGTLIAELSQEYLSEVLKSVSIANGGFSYLVDRNGFVVASTMGQNMGRDLSQSTTYLKLLTENSGTMIDEKEGDLLAFHAMADGWGLVLGVPEDVAFQSVEKLSSLLTVGFLCILLFSLGLIGVGMKQNLYPIVQLTQLARDFSNETSLWEIERLKKYHSLDELGELMRTILIMGRGNLEKQAMLEEKERYLHDVIEGIPYAIVTLNNNGVVTHLNRSFEKLTGFSRENVRGMSIIDLPLKKDIYDFVVLQTLQSDRLTEDRETYILDVEGQTHMVKVKTSKFFNNKKENIGIIAVLEDISHIKLLEEHVKQREKLALIGQITSGIAHEIKNPLAILSGASELLREEVGEYHQEGTIWELTEDIYQVVSRMKGITSDFLNFAKIKQETTENICMRKLLDEVLHLLRIKLQETKIEVVRDYPDVVPMLKGSYGKLMQVYLNLFLNSIEAMPMGGTLTIRLYTVWKDTGRFIYVDVADTGIGIPQKDLQWLLNPFFSTKVEGSGLGLTIARDIVVEHGGQIHIESKPNYGTTISTDYPVEG